jgi:hypothetical protein
MTDKSRADELECYDCTDWGDNGHAQRTISEDGECTDAEEAKRIIHELEAENESLRANLVDEELRWIKSLLWSDLEKLTGNERKHLARVVGEIMALPQVAQLRHDNERLRADAVYYDAVRREHDSALARVKELESLCSRYQAETHALRELNERLEQTDAGKLSLEVDRLRRLADVLEVERDEARQALEETNHA